MIWPNTCSRLRLCCFDQPSISNMTRNYMQEGSRGNFEQQECFQASDERRELEVIPMGKARLIGQPNPIYTSKKQENELQYDAFVGFKIIPVLRPHDISAYVGFRMARQDKAKKKVSPQPTTISEPRNLRVLKHQLLSRQGSFGRHYSNTSMVYLQLDNSKCNKLKETVYFSALFVPMQQLTAAFKKTLECKCLDWKTLREYSKKISSPEAAQCLAFDSNFESGNLFSSFCVSQFEYDLVVRSDINSRGSTQWFYFSVEGLRVGASYTFNIVNFTKNDSLFNYGLRPVHYSVVQNNGIPPDQYSREEHGHLPGWCRTGRDVSYCRSELLREGSANRYYYTLTFVVDVRRAQGKVYFAHSYPYTYTQMACLMESMLLKFNHVSELSKPKLAKNDEARLDRIPYGKSLANIDLYAYCLSTLTKRNERQAIVIMARQHPGEPQGSFVFEGIIRMLAEATAAEVKFLTRNYDFYLLPMVNPDGVIFGNYRTNLAGKDLNRKWDIDSKAGPSIVPEVTALKQFLCSLAQKNIAIKFMLDLHGHSKKLSSFFYGNPCAQSPETVRMFPYICSRFSEAVQFLDCTFSAQETKKKSARVHLSAQHSLPYVYTFESSFHGYRRRSGQLVEFTPQEYSKLGRVLLTSLYHMLLKENAKILQLRAQTELSFNVLKGTSQKMAALDRMSLSTYEQFQAQLKSNRLLLGVGDGDSSGSQSKPQEGELNLEQIQLEQIQKQDQKSEQFKLRITEGDERPHGRKAHESIKTRSIRVSTRKHTYSSSIQQASTRNQDRNSKRVIPISQITTFLPDKFQISLLPVDRSSFNSGHGQDAQLIARKFAQSNKARLRPAIDSQSNTVNQAELRVGVDKSISSYLTPKVNSSLRKDESAQPKKHAEIIAQIQKRTRPQRDSLTLDRDLLNKKATQGIRTDPFCKSKSTITNSRTLDEKYMQRHQEVQKIMSLKGQSGLRSMRNDK